MLMQTTSLSRSIPANVGPILEAPNCLEIPPEGCVNTSAQAELVLHNTSKGAPANALMYMLHRNNYSDDTQEATQSEETVEHTTHSDVRLQHHSGMRLKAP